MEHQPTILTLTSIVRKYQGNEFENIYGLGDDGKIYKWIWSTGEWELNQKPICSASSRADSEAEKL